jgi:predicted NAD/FAD-binding protein
MIWTNALSLDAAQKKKVEVDGYRAEGELRSSTKQPSPALLDSIEGTSRAESVVHRGFRHSLWIQVAMLGVGVTSVAAIFWHCSHGRLAIQKKQIERSAIGGLPQYHAMLEFKPTVLHWTGLAAMACGQVISPVAALVTLQMLLWKVVAPTAFLVILLLSLIVFQVAVIRHAYKNYQNAYDLGTWARVTVRCLFLAFMLGVCLVYLYTITLVQIDEGSLHVRSGLYDAGAPVAVVGSGASGLTAAWMLHAAGRTVHVFEAGQQLGATSYTWRGQDPTTGREAAVDLGNMFIRKGDDAYRTMATHFGVDLREAVLNVGSVYTGLPWENTASVAGQPALEAEIRRFLLYANQPASATRALTPLWLWLYVKRFSSAFVNRCLMPSLSVLQLNSNFQSTQSVLNYFKKGPGQLLTFDSSHGSPPAAVQYIEGGSARLWNKITKDIGETHFSTGQAVTRILRDGKTWTLRFADESEARSFSDVILALPPEAAADLVQDASPLAKGLVHQVPTTVTYMTLHADESVMEKASGHELFLDDRDRALQTLRVGRIFGGGLLLSAHDSPTTFIKPEKVVLEFQWKHHVDNLWNELITRPALGVLNGANDAHYAGDWSVGAGTEDSIRAGVYAACKAGLPKEIKATGGKQEALYAQLISLCRDQ